MTLVSRRELITALALGMLGLAGCGSNSNEKDFTDKPGQAPPDAPQTAEEYELKNAPKAGEP
ncbi:MAG: hypothetical protein ABI353_01715 [Isosphaeraceae bacterium]